jgi:internalin A
LSRNKISDIGLLSQLYRLQTLQVDGNLISDISSLRGLDDLKSIKLVGNDEIPCLDVVALEEQHPQAKIARPATCINIADINFTDTALKACVADAAVEKSWFTADQVKTLSCVDQGVKTLIGLDKLTALEFLDLRRNTIVDTKLVSNLIHLTTLKLAKNQVAEISTVSKLTELTFLSISENNFDVTTLNALIQLTKLDTLYLRDNQLTNITALGQMPQLKRLYLSNNQIADISQLAPLTALLTLKLEKIVSLVISVRCSNSRAPIILIYSVTIRSIVLI